MTPADRLFVALDFATADEALGLVAKLDGVATRYKIGLELFAAAGPSVVERVRAHGRVFLDLKLHDIPETVRRAAASIAGLGVDWLTVHAAGGPAMLEAAVAGGGAARVLAVTVLTSLDASDLDAVGFRPGTVEERAVALARLAERAGCAGVIASPKEARAIRAAVGNELLIVTPGVRAQAGGDDQKRVATASEAIAGGASAVVVGRPIRDASDPRAAALSLIQSLA